MYNKQNLIAFVDRYIFFKLPNGLIEKGFIFLVAGDGGGVNISLFLRLQWINGVAL